MACSSILPNEPRPIFQVSTKATLLIVGQAPGRKAHETSKPFNDLSGDRLRDWLGIDRVTFYDSSRVALLPMAFCFPGSGTYGDRPPPPRCAELWRTKYETLMPDIRLTVACGRYAVDYYCARGTGQALAQIVKNWRQLPNDLMVLPHPSPRNNGWIKTNKWFEQDVLPELQRRVNSALDL